MDQVALVENQIEDGQKLVLQLVQDNFDVTAAFWLKTSEEGKWFLYIASKVVDEAGPVVAYRAVYASLRRLPDPWVSLSEIKVIGAANPIARDVFKILKRYSGRTPIHFGGAQLGGVGIEEAYIYPRPARGKRSAFAWEERKLKTAVEQTPRMDEFLPPATPQEKKALNQLVASGMDRQRADYWIRKRRDMEHPRPPIPAGTVVKTMVTAWWGDKPEDDPNPLLLVEAPDGAQGLTFKSNTEPV